MSMNYHKNGLVSTEWSPIRWQMVYFLCAL